MSPLPSGSLKRSQHLGPSDIYLDDLPSLDSENAALYFPQRCLDAGCQGVLGLGYGWSGVGYQGPERGGPLLQPPCSHITVGPSAPSDCGLGPRRWSEPNSQKPLGDPNPEQEPEPSLDMVDMVALSLCGGLADSGDISLGMSDQGLGPSEDWHWGWGAAEVGGEAGHPCGSLPCGALCSQQGWGIPKALQSNTYW